IRSATAGGSELRFHLILHNGNSFAAPLSRRSLRGLPSMSLILSSELPAVSSGAWLDVCACEGSLNLADGQLWICNFDDERRVALILQINRDGFRGIVHIPKHLCAVLVESTRSDDAGNVGARSANTAGALPLRCARP